MVGYASGHRRRCRYSESLFSRLHSAHSSCRFSSVVAPPSATGSTWSYWSSKLEPHCTQRPPSRSYTARPSSSWDRLSCRDPILFGAHETARALEPGSSPPLALERERLHVFCREPLVVPVEPLMEQPHGPSAAVAHSDGLIARSAPDRRDRVRLEALRVDPPSGTNRVSTRDHIPHAPGKSHYFGVVVDAQESRSFVCRLIGNGRRRI